MSDTKLQEKSFQDYLLVERLSATRVLCILGALLYLLFAVADIYSLSVTLTEVLVVRGSVALIMLATIAASYLKNFNDYYNVIVSSGYILAAAGIEAMIYLALPEDHASNAYFSGIILVIMTVFAWGYFRPFLSISIVVIIVGSYAYIGILKHMAISSLLVNILFLLSAASIGFISQTIRDRYLRENFLLQQSLKDAIKEKTIEADDNAYLANHDPLTDLPNRRYVTELLEGSLKIAEEKGEVLALLFLDLNGFKQVNDIYGHAAGDAVLVIVAKRLELAIREGDHLSRLGGDEYLVSLMMDKASLYDIQNMAAKFTAIISEPMNIDGIRIKVGVSIGIAAYPMHGNKVSVLMDIADKKMYRVKQGVHKINKERAEKAEPVIILPSSLRSK